MTLLFFSYYSRRACFLRHRDPLCYFFWVLLFIRYICRPRAGIVPRIYCCIAVVLLLLLYYYRTHIVGSWGVGGSFFPPVCCCAVLLLYQVLRTAVVHTTYQVLLYVVHGGWVDRFKGVSTRSWVTLNKIQ